MENEIRKPIEGMIELETQYQSGEPCEVKETSELKIMTPDKLSVEKLQKTTRKYKEVLKRVYNRERLNRAWQQVKKNAGAAGIDKMTVGKFEENAERNLATAARKLKAGKYQFKPLKEVLIPKEGGTRKLGIPVVMDRVVSQSMNMVMMEIYEPEFKNSSYGYRPGKSQHEAIGKMKEHIKEGREWVVEVDLKNFFDEIPHPLILKRVREKVEDDQMITLIARAIKSGRIKEGRYEKSQKGVPQGSPISPILSNIVLHELDQELENRGHRHCRWADDFLIYMRSERAGKRVKESITKYLRKMGLEVNEDKSGVTRAEEAKFLGFQIQNGQIRISPKAKKKFKRNIREMTKRNNPLSMKKIVEDLNVYLKGWVGYFTVEETQTTMGNLDGWIRRRLRSMQLKKWKKPKKFQAKMRKAGYSVYYSEKTWLKMDVWRSSRNPKVHRVLPVKWFRKLKLVFLDDYRNRDLELPFDSQSRSVLPGRYESFCWEGAV